MRLVRCSNPTPRQQARQALRLPGGVNLPEPIFLMTADARSRRYGVHPPIQRSQLGAPRRLPRACQAGGNRYITKPATMGRGSQ